MQLDPNGNFKGNAQFLFLFNPRKSDASRVCITLLQITKKMLTKDISLAGTYHWNSKISTEIHCEKNNLSAFLIFQKICKKLKKKIFLTYIRPLKVNCRHPYLSPVYSHFVLFSPSFFYSSRYETHSTMCNVWFDFITSCR